MNLSSLEEYSTSMFYYSGVLGGISDNTLRIGTSIDSTKTKTIQNLYSSNRYT